MATWEEYNKNKTQATTSSKGWGAYNQKMSEKSYRAEAKQYKIDPTIYTNLRKAGNNAFTIKNELSAKPVSYIKNLGSGIAKSTKEFFGGFFPVMRSTTQTIATPVAGLFASVPGGVSPSEAMKESWEIAKGVGSFKEEPEKAVYQAVEDFAKMRGLGKYGGNDITIMDYATIAGIGFANLFGDPMFEAAMGMIKPIKALKEFAKFKKIGSVSKELPEGSKFITKNTLEIPITENSKLKIKPKTGEIVFTGYEKRFPNKGDIINPDTAKMLKGAKEATGADVSAKMKNGDLIMRPSANTSAIHIPQKGVYAKVGGKTLDYLRNEVDNIPWSKGDTPHLTAITENLKTKAKEVSINEIRTMSKNIDKALKNVDAQASVDGIKSVRAKDVVDTTDYTKKTIINPDDLKKVANDYNPANHSIYSKLAKEQYQKALAENQNPLVKFTAGGSGSGKSELVLKRIEKDFDGIIVDGVMGDFKSASKKIQQAMDAGKAIEINAILPRTKSALKFVQKRALDTGRDVPLEYFAELHSGFIKTFPKIIKEFPDAKISLLDNRLNFSEKLAMEAKPITNKEKILKIFEDLESNKDRLLESLKNVKYSGLIVEDVKPNLEDIVKEINAGGISWNVVKNKNLGGEPYNSVSIYPELSATFKGKIKESDILKYVIDNIDVLKNKNHALGGWYDETTKELWLDVVAVVKNEKTAIALGKQYNQKAIFNLERFEEINTGGTGEMVEGLPKIWERIKMVKHINDDVKVKPKAKPKVKKVPRDQLPQGSGKERASKLDARVSGITAETRSALNNVSQETIDDLGVATYKQLNKADNIKKATKFALEEPDKAMDVLLGKEQAPKGILTNSIYIAMQNIAKGDFQLATKLASLRATRMGQEISILSELDKTSPVYHINELIKIQEKAITKKLKKPVTKAIKETKAKIKDEISKEVKHIKKTEKDLKDFIDNIKC